MGLQRLGRTVRPLIGADLIGSVAICRGSARRARSGRTEDIGRRQDRDDVGHVGAQGYTLSKGLDVADVPLQTVLALCESLKCEPLRRLSAFAAVSSVQVAALRSHRRYSQASPAAKTGCTRAPKGVPRTARCARSGAANRTRGESAGNCAAARVN